jgi:NTE family protein
MDNAIPPPTPTPPLSIGLALSGGGTRAALFHLGVLRFLAEQGRIGEVKYISTVSGGSLITALVLKANHYAWPANADAFAEAHRRVIGLMDAHSLQTAYLTRQPSRAA